MSRLSHAPAPASSSLIVFAAEACRLPQTQTDRFDFDEAFGAGPGRELDEQQLEATIDDADVEAQSHQVQLDMGDDAVNADASIAEAGILARYPTAETILIDRQQRRARRGNAGEFKVEWQVYVSLPGGLSAYGSDADLDQAVSRCLSKFDTLRSAVAAVAA